MDDASSGSCSSTGSPTTDLVPTVCRYLVFALHVKPELEAPVLYGHSKLISSGYQLLSDKENRCDQCGAIEMIA
ncbi:hypothetical protein Clacol_000489 [Clathrus columnatus]|uniref:Uncharacterized protein n=1 Tax=Clathrus columnatus TaxID=1419009 RepID=A0AAV5A0Z5_9AGAM|nr:hypothetical protein Clacol_000489 [Clathrus columnatus]